MNKYSIPHEYRATNAYLHLKTAQAYDKFKLITNRKQLTRAELSKTCHTMLIYLLIFERLQLTYL